MLQTLLPNGVPASGSILHPRPPSTLKSGLCSFCLGILRVYRRYLGGLGRGRSLGFMLSGCGTAGFRVGG